MPAIDYWGAIRSLADVSDANPATFITALEYWVSIHPKLAQYAYDYL